MKALNSQGVIITKPFLADVSGSGIDLLLFDKNGRRMYARGRGRIHGYMDHGIKLTPGESLINFINVSRWGFGEIIEGGGIALSEDTYLPVGDYKIQLSYDYTSDNETITVYSNIIDFKVTEPNESDMDAFVGIRELLYNSINMNELEFSNLLDNLVTKYSSSPYILSMYNYALLITPNTKEEYKEKLLLKMIEDHPSSFSTLKSVIDCPNIKDEFNNTAASRLTVKSELNKKMLENYENYQKIINRK